jgi:hypothetical protein
MVTKTSDIKTETFQCINNLILDNNQMFSYFLKRVLVLIYILFKIM